MKQIKYTLLLMFIVCVFLYTSCSKSNTPVPIPQIATTSISLKFSGGFYNSTNAVAVYNKNLNAVRIEAVLGNNAFIHLVVPDAKVGSFDLSGGNASLSFFTGNSLLDTYSSTKGSIVISEFSNTAIVGTFQFTGVDSLKVTRAISEGQFTTSYTTQ